MAVWLSSLGGLLAVGAVVLPHGDGTFESRAMTLRIHGPSWNITYETASSNATAFRLLGEANATLGFELQWVEYGWPYYDVLVTSINGARNDRDGNLWWQYCVDGVYASVGARNQEVRAGDVVTWVYAAPGGNELCA